MMTLQWVSALCCGRARLDLMIRLRDVVCVVHGLAMFPSKCRSGSVVFSMHLVHCCTPKRVGTNLVVV
jgi:hypothetical protein